MNSRFIIAALACSNALCFANIKVDAPWRATVTQMIKNTLPHANVGVVVQDAVSREIIYTYHANKHFLPASTAKLFTAAAALKYLGPEYRFATSLLYKPGAIKRHVYRDHLVLRFSGDPSLQRSSLQALFQNLSSAKIKVIKGDLLIDDSIFAGPTYALGWAWDSTPWYHAAPTNAIIIDGNQFGVTLLPSDTLGDQVKVTLNPEDSGTNLRQISSDVRTVSYADSENLCQLIANVDDNNNLQLGGCWPQGSSPIQLRFAIKNPRLQATQLIQRTLQDLNIKFAGQIKFAPTPADMQVLAQHTSEPVAALIKPILSESNNVYAESLTKTIGAQMYGVGSFKTGTAGLQRVLQDTMGLDLTAAKFVDGSGESHYNLLMPQHLAQLLLSMRFDPQVAGHFRNALAVSGMNGTLQNRFGKNIPQVFAKTGTMHGVSTLAGYFTTKQKREVIIAIMINHATETNKVLKQFEEELCYFLMEQL